MSIKVLEEVSIKYNIYAVKSNPDDEIELNENCKFAENFADKNMTIGYAICLAENFEYTDVFVTEVKTINNYWNTDDAVKDEKIVWSCMKIADESEENSEDD